jgi:hypothetical protein
MITRSVQRDRYCQHNNEGADEIDFSTLSSIPLLLRIIVATFPTCSVVSIGVEYTYQVLHVPPQEEVAWKFTGVEEHSRTFHTQHNTHSILENRHSIFTKF